MEIGIEFKHKKSTILYVLKILKECSNEEHPISQIVMAKTLQKMGIKCDRKTIARDIDCLIECGYKVVKKDNKGCYLENDSFTREEIDFLSDGISKLDISIDKKFELKKKIEKLININERRY